MALNLIDELKNTSSNFRGIRLKCRNDYEANSFWEKAHFLPVKEVTGRSKQGHLLTVWWYENPRMNLFANLGNLELNQRIVVAIDTNIFLDLRLNRNTESLSLQNDWLDDEIEICVTSEIFNEINRNKSKEIREECRMYVQNFRQLEFDESKFQEIHSLISGKFKQNSARDKSDLNQIICAIIGNVEYFLTRDEYWMSKSQFFETNYNISILSPSTFITELDEKKESSKYQPTKLVSCQ